MNLFQAEMLALQNQGLSLEEALVSVGGVRGHSEARADQPMSDDIEQAVSSQRKSSAKKPPAKEGWERATHKSRLKQEIVSIVAEDRAVQAKPGLPKDTQPRGKGRRPA